MFFDFITIEFFGDNNILFELKINSNDIIKSILYQLVSNYNNNNNTNINNIILNKQTNIQKKYFKRKIFVFFS